MNDVNEECICYLCTVSKDNGNLNSLVNSYLVLILLFFYGDVITTRCT